MKTAAILMLIAVLQASAFWDFNSIRSITKKAFSKAEDLKDQTKELIIAKYGNTLESVKKELLRIPQWMKEFYNQRMTFIQKDLGKQKQASNDQL